MKLRQIQELLEAELLWGEDLLDEEIESAFGSDLMSDVLAFVREKTVLLTGLTNAHVLRTADMLDVKCVVFVRGKRPSPEMLEMAKERDIALMATKHTLYVSCGKLYAKGIPGVNREE
ncbi:MAG TPA: hypothetical protein IAA59_00705 [Candidatus Faecaligallichristensenella faecipullorum]|nr:hypothetical protein [Candidatus Faecaligallichristensenella faecipullorum]